LKIIVRVVCLVNIAIGNEENMPKISCLLDRYWSVATAIILTVIVLLTEWVVSVADYEVVRSVLSVVCIVLLVHSWFMQRGYERNKRRLAFFTL